MTIFYFTGTGNSLAVAKRIGGPVTSDGSYSPMHPGTLISIPQVINSADRHYKDDVIGVVFPVYFATAPDMVLDFLARAKFECDYSFIISTSGGTKGASLLIAKRVLKQSGHQFDYMDDVVTVDNSMSMASIEAQIARKADSKFAPKLEEIANNIAERKQNTEKKAGAALSMFSFVVSKLPNYENVPKKFYIDDKCNGCKTCTRVCPAGNIQVSDQVKFGKDCTGCFACLHLCPKNAIHRKCERSAARWRHPDVSLNEIIAANNRLNEMEDV